MKKIVILCPSIDEYTGVCNKFSKSDTFKPYFDNHINLDYKEETFKYLDTIISINQLGIGRTLSSFNLQNILHSSTFYTNEMVILCGVCGALTNDLETGDVIIPNSIKVGDFDIGGLDYSGIADSDKQNLGFNSNISCQSASYKLAEQLGCIKANIVTIDSFADNNRKEELRKINNDNLPAIVDMETASVFSLLNLLGMTNNFFVFRAVADGKNKDNDDLQEYNNTLNFAIEQVADICYRFTKEIVTNQNNNLYSKGLKWIPDFPIKGVNFLDIQSILNKPSIFNYVIDSMKNYLSGSYFDKIVALDARGFIFGSVISYLFNVPLVMARKKGKLPDDCYSISYGKEYGKDIIEIEKDTINKNDVVAIIDDILVTGGTVEAVKNLIEDKFSAKVNSIVVAASIGDEYKEKFNIPIKSIFSF